MRICYRAKGVDSTILANREMLKHRRKAIKSLAMKFSLRFASP